MRVVSVHSSSPATVSGPTILTRTKTRAFKKCWGLPIANRCDGACNREGAPYRSCSAGAAGADMGGAAADAAPAGSHVPGACVVSVVGSKSSAL